MIGHDGTLDVYRRLYPDRLFVAAAAGWLVVAGCIVWWPTVPHWPLRIGAVVLLVAAVWRLVQDRPVMLLSPLLLLPVVSVVFFAVLPAIYASPERLANFRPDFQLPIERYFSGPAELIVLQFALALLALALVLRPRFLLLSHTDSPRSADMMGFFALATVFGLVALLIVRWAVPSLAQWMQSGIGLQAAHGIPPLMSLSIAALAWRAARHRSWRPVAIFSGGLGCIALFSLANAKVPAFIAASSLLLFAVVLSGDLKKLWWSCVAALCVIVISTLVLTEIRSGTISNYFSGRDERGVSALSTEIIYKLVLRQIDTVGCFSNVVERRLLVPPERSPTYFLVAVVPRTLWPGKPNLSQGDRFAVDYCDIAPPLVYGWEAVHSASVTLLGEPIIAAGLRGLAVAQLTLLVVLALATQLLLRAGAVGAITLVALLPWLVDFDQSLALYLANATKMFLYMGPGILLIAWATRHALLRGQARAPNG